MRKKSLRPSKHKKEISMKLKLAGTAIAIGLLAACVSAQSTGKATDGVAAFSWISLGVHSFFS